MTFKFETIRVEIDARQMATLTLTRPDVRNAFDAQLIYDLHQAFLKLAENDDLRGVLLRGEGPAFCAGADLNWMKASAELSIEENEEGARKMADMFEAIATCPAPVIAVVHGHALGGGAGLVAAADVAIGVTRAKIGFTEVLLGIVPAVISPFVLRKVPETHARRYFVTGEIFDGAEAERIGLLQKCLADEAALEAEVEGLVAALLRAGPRASRESKDLITAVKGLDILTATGLTAPLIAKLRASPEGQEGMAAFLQKRKAGWIPGEGS